MSDFNNQRKPGYQSWVKRSKGSDNFRESREWIVEQAKELYERYGDTPLSLSNLYLLWRFLIAQQSLVKSDNQHTKENRALAEMLVKTGLDVRKKTVKIFEQALERGSGTKTCEFFGCVYRSKGQDEFAYSRWFNQYTDPEAVEGFDCSNYQPIGHASVAELLETMRSYMQSTGDELAQKVGQHPKAFDIWASKEWNQCIVEVIKMLKSVAVANKASTAKPTAAPASSPATQSTSSSPLTPKSKETPQVVPAAPKKIAQRPAAPSVWDSAKKLDFSEAPSPAPAPATSSTTSRQDYPCSDCNAVYASQQVWTPEQRELLGSWMQHQPQPQQYPQQPQAPQAPQYQQQPSSASEEFVIIPFMGPDNKFTPVMVPADRVKNLIYAMPMSR